MEKRWLSIEDLLVRWQAKPFEILEAHKSGLPLYGEKGNCVVYPEIPEDLSPKEQQKLNKLDSDYFNALFSEDPSEREDAVFKLSDVVAYEKKHGIHFAAENYAIMEGLAADTPINSEEYFPELNIHLLKMQAERWIKKFSEAPIKRVLLYNFSSKYEGMMIARNGLPPHPALYAIVFDVDAIDKTTKMGAEERLKYDLMGVRGERLQESYERLLAATKPNKRIADKEQYYDLMTRDFEKIYKNQPKPGYREQWQFYCIFKNTHKKTSLTANIRTDEPHIVLWQQDWGEKIQKCAKKARQKGHINILKLCHILAYDDGSSAKLPALWREYHMDKRGPSIPETETFEKRVGAWSMLIQCLTTGFDGIPDQGELPYLKTRKKDTDNGVYVEAPKNEGTHVNLQTLKDYFANTLFVPTQLPELLFPEDLIDGSEPAAINKTDYYFILKGDYWDVGFAGETSTLKDLKGLRTVVVLLKNPNHEFYPLELQQVVEGLNEDLSDEDRETRDNYTNMSKKSPDDDSQLQSEELLSLKDLPIDNLFENKEQRKWFEKLINETWERKTENDSTEWEQLKNYLLNEKGVRLRYTIRGPVYKYLGRLDNDNEKARKTIHKNVKKFMGKIKSNMPSLKDHLKNQITTGNKFIYIADPTEPISWQIKD